MGHRGLTLSAEDTCLTGSGPCFNRKSKACFAYTKDTNVCPCGTQYNDETKDQGHAACCGAGCPTHRDLTLSADDTCLIGTGPCFNPKNKACFAYTKDTNVCPCGTQYNDETKDQGHAACCGAGCPTHRDLTLSVEDTCQSGSGPCLNSKTGWCDKYVCKTGSWDDCREYTNVCACGTQYNDNSKDQGDAACCGDGCPTHRDLVLSV